MKIYTVYDSGIEAYMMPFYAKARGEALRSFIEVANDVNHQIGKHPQDFTLFELGDFDEATAKFTIFSTPISCGLALELIKK